MKIFAIDPGTLQSAYILWNGKNVLEKGIVNNALLLETIIPSLEMNLSIIEMVASYGMPVGKEIFETVRWIGRFEERILTVGYSKKVELVYRREVKLHHCHSAKAKDANIRQALVDKYGKPGTKKNPGVTYGITKDMWSAFALATYKMEGQK